MDLQVFVAPLLSFFFIFYIEHTHIGNKGGGGRCAYITQHAISSFYVLKNIYLFILHTIRCSICIINNICLVLKIIGEILSKTYTLLSLYSIYYE
jgi:hypothetical protein